MKKSLIKYFGVASTTLLAVAPVVAPVVQNALNATLTNKVFAADNTGTRVPMDLSGQNEYSKLLQQAIINPDASFVSVNGDIAGNLSSNPVNINTVKGLIKLAQYTNGVSDTDITNEGGFVYADTSDNANIHQTDVAKYLFTNTNGTTRTYVKNFYYYKDHSNEFKNGVEVKKGTAIYEAVQFISNKLGSHTIADILGTSYFDNPNEATLKISINGSDGKDLDAAQLLKQGRIVITLTAQTGNTEGSKKTAQAFLNLNNSTVLLNKSTAEGSGNSFAAAFSGYANTANLAQFGVTAPANDFLGLVKTYAIDNAPEKLGLDANAEENKTKVDDLNDKLGAYATDTIVVPEGTSLDTIENKLKNVRYKGTPAVANYGSVLVSGGQIAFDDVVAKDNLDWDAQISQANGNLFSNVTAGSAASSLNSILNNSGVSRSAIVARPGSYSVKVPVKGNVYVPSSVNSSEYQFNSNSQVYMKNYPAETNVNVIVYANPSYWNKQYSLGTLPSFALFAPTTANAVVPTFYDNGQTVKTADLPYGLQSKNLNITVGDPRFYDPNSKTTSQNKLNSYLQGAVSNAVKNKQILISDEEVKSSHQPIDTNNLKPDVDFPDGASYYTQRPDSNTNNAGNGSSFSIDSSAVDLSKAGTYDVKVTYINAKNGKFGLGKEQSTITIPLTVGESDSPAFYFIGGLDQTIKVGDKFNQMNFKVAKSLDEINQMVANGTANDGKDYVNDPDKTGVDVSISGSVDTSVPDTYTLVYTATNVATGKTTSLTRRINVINGTGGGNETNDKITEFKATGYVDYVPGYGINVWNAPKGQATGQKLPDASAWKISHKAEIDGKVWYQVGKNQWIDGAYVSLNPISRMKPMSGTIKIEYIPGYSVRVYQSADTSKPTEKLLKHGTAWKVFGEMNGFYNVGANQWIKVEYAKRF